MRRSAGVLPSVVECDGDTPLVELSSLTAGMPGRILAKLEHLNPGSSKKERIDVAARLDDLRIPAGNRLEAPKGVQAKWYSVRVNDQYRVTFRWEQGHACEVRVEDQNFAAMRYKRFAVAR
jgi:plasmid maintenance system killer protein